MWKFEATKSHAITRQFRSFSRIPVFNHNIHFSKAKKGSIIIIGEIKIEIICL